MRTIHIRLIATAAVLHLTIAAAAAQTTYDLKTNWSNAQNPFSAWTVAQGATPLPADADWTPISNYFIEYNPASGHIAQPAWAPGNQTGTFLPGWFKATVAVNSNSTVWKKGDVVTHTTDVYNGGGHGVSTLVFTAPAAGHASVSGTIWNARQFNRPQNWQIAAQGKVLASGTLPGNGTITRAAPTHIHLPRQTLPAGGAVTLTLAPASGSTPGDLIGCDLKIVLSP